MLQTASRAHTEFREHRGAATTATTATATTATATAAAATGGELLFQRCRWCRTPAYRRSLCRTCGSTELEWERSAGIGVVVRRNVPAAHSAAFITMDEGFTLVCRVTGAPPMAVSGGVRVRVVSALDPLNQGLPVVELCNPVPSAESWR